MSKRQFIVTGTSRGIGEQIAKLLLERGDVVHGIARGSAGALLPFKEYNHYPFDLSNLYEIEHLQSRILERIRAKDVDMVCLINNAAIVEPLKPIPQCSLEEIDASLRINLMAPIALASSFIRQTDQWPIRRKIINLSSGSGSFPAPDMSLYCTAKAGINMFTQCVGAEQSYKANPVEIVAVDPGMVDTEMQATARGKEEGQFEMAAFFRQAHQTGQLQTSEELATRMLNLIDSELDIGKIIRA